MDLIDREITRALEERIGGLEATPMLSAGALRQIKIRRAFVALTTGALGVAVVGMGFLGAHALTDPKQPVKPAPATVAPAADSVSPDKPERTTPVVTIASGTEEDGTEWSLRGYKAVRVEGPEAGSNILCLRWKIGPTQDDDFSCFGDGRGSYLEGPLLLKVMNPGGGEPPERSLYGGVPATTTRVELELADGSVEEAQVFDAPEELGGMRVFIAFNPPEVVSITGYDDSGAVTYQDSE